MMMLLMLLGLVIHRLIVPFNVIEIAHVGVIFLDRIVEDPVLFFYPAFRFQKWFPYLKGAGEIDFQFHFQKITQYTPHSIYFSLLFEDFTF